MNRTWRRLCSAAGVVLTAGFLGGCADDGVAIGDGDVQVDRNNIGSYADAWVGYVEAHEFGSGSDRIRIVIEPDGSGYVQVGTAPAIESFDPDTLPNVDFSRRPNDQYFYWLNVQLFDGYRYPFSDAQVEEERLRLILWPREGFAEWCSLQTPHAYSNGYTCDPTNWSFSESNGQCSHTDASGELLPVDCGLVHGCEQICVCDEHECGVPEPAEKPGEFDPGFVFDAALDDSGDELTGTLLLTDATARTVRLTRE